MIFALFFCVYLIFSFISRGLFWLNRLLLLISSGMPPVFDAITGVFAAKPSRIMMPNGSYVEGTIRMSQVLMYSWIFSAGSFP